LGVDTRAFSVTFTNYVNILLEQEKIKFKPNNLENSNRQPENKIVKGFYRRNMITVTICEND